MNELDLLRRLSRLDDLADEQNQHLNYLYETCWHCANHSIIMLRDHTFYICNDNWSGMNVGEHIFYSETRDMCIEHNGFKQK